MTIQADTARGVSLVLDPMPAEYGRCCMSTTKQPLTQLDLNDVPHIDH
jgi:hypothetical protein